jgi:hypothetical protein
MEVLRANHEADIIQENHDTIDRLLFEEYLTAPRNDLYDPKKQAFDPFSLDEPLSHYWISTSHNTYLVIGLVTIADCFLSTRGTI